MAGWDGEVWVCGSRCSEVHTSLACGLKLSWTAVLPVASYGAGTDLDHIAGVRPQPVQLHRVLLAGHRGGNALALQHQEKQGTSVALRPISPCCPRGPPAAVSVPKTVLPRAPATHCAPQGPCRVIFSPQGLLLLLPLKALTFSKYFIS